MRSFVVEIVVWGNRVVALAGNSFAEDSYDDEPSRSVLEEEEASLCGLFGRKVWVKVLWILPHYGGIPRDQCAGLTGGGCAE